jgi:hypothetical protein
MHSSSPPFVLYALPTYRPWLDQSNCTWRRVQVMKLLIMQCSPISCHFIPLPNIPLNTLLRNTNTCENLTRKVTPKANVTQILVNTKIHFTCQK